MSKWETVGDRIFKDQKFRKWLEEEKNYDPRIIHALGKESFIRSLRREYLLSRRNKLAYTKEKVKMKKVL